jgi:SAM-dependent methyltransferase
MDTQNKYQIIKTRLQKKFPFFGGILTKNEQVMDAQWRVELVSDLEKLFGDVEGDGFDKALGGYVEFSIDAAKNQEFFIKRGHYKATNFSEVKHELLDNAEHMLGNYLPGMFVSHYFWPHHYRMGRRYRSEIMPRVRDRSPRLFVEVGTGSAMYTLLTMSSLAQVRGIGYDISPHSVAFGRRVATAFGFADRFTFVEQDAFANPPRDKADYIVSQEVLEHLEDPLTFCKNLHGILKDDGYAYITAAVTAAHSDHIYLFNSPAELKSMLEAAGFRSVLYIEESSDDRRVPDKTPRICGHLLEKYR